MKYFIYGLLGALFVVIGSESYAATTRPISVDPKSISAFLFTPNNLDGVVLGRFETIATTPQNQQVTRYTARPVPLNKARLGSLARSAVGGPAVLAATAAYLAYDYFYNDNTDQWVVTPRLSTEIIPGSICRPRAGEDLIYDVSMATCWDAYFEANKNSNGVISPDITYFKSSDNGTNQVWCARSPGVATCHNLNSYTFPSDYEPPFSEPITAQPRNATDTDLGDAVKNAPAPAVQDILNDPISTGTWRDRWPEIEPVAQEIEDQLGHDIEGGPAPIIIDPTITDSSTYNPPQTDTGSGGSMSTEWPTFCGWAGVVCSFIDWVQEPFAEPPPVEVPYVDIDFEEDYDSGIAIAQCPAPIAMNITLGSSVRAINFEWTPLCTFADTVRPLIIAFSYLIGIYILLRVK